MIASTMTSGNTKKGDPDPWDQIPRTGAAGLLREAPLSVSMATSDASFIRARDHLGLRMLILETNVPPATSVAAPAMSGLRIDEHRHGRGCRTSLTLLEGEYAGPFVSLCDDIISEVSRATDAETARKIFVHRTRVWQDLLRLARKPRLSDEEQMGVIGELIALKDLLMPAIGAADAVAAWTGPLGSPKDFEAGRVWIECKAFGAAGARRIRITSEHQLDDDGSDALFLHVAPLSRNTPADLGGMTLTEWVDKTRSAIRADSPSAIAPFNMALEAAGYDDRHEYDTTWSSGECSIFRVEDGFPRIIPHGFPAGLRDVNYSLPLEQIEAWRATPSDVAGAMGKTV